MRSKERIGAGAYSDVYAWKEGQALKLFDKSVAADDIDYEAQAVRAIHAEGLPVPKLVEELAIDGRLGLVYELVEGETMFDICERTPLDRLRCARMLPEIHAQLHLCSGMASLKSQREELERRIHLASSNGLPADLQAAALNALAAMPDGDQLCHGDYWPENILMSAKGPVVIDWGGATIGDPLSDVARTFVFKDAALYRAQAGPAMWIYSSFLERYSELRPGDEQAVRSWIPIIAAGCFGETFKYPPPKKWLLRVVSDGLQR